MSFYHAVYCRIAQLDVADLAAPDADLAAPDADLAAPDADLAELAAPDLAGPGPLAMPAGAMLCVGILL